jgi:hypothetical protein
MHFLSPCIRYLGRSYTGKIQTAWRHAPKIAAVLRTAVIMAVQGEIGPFSDAGTDENMLPVACAM